MADPFRERRFGADEVRRIVRRATELAERDPEAAPFERALTLDELERAAGELGLPASVVARAAAGSGEDEPAARPRERSVFLGGPTRVVFEKEVDGEPSEADREDLIEDVRDAIGETGSVESVGKTLTWKLTPVYGRGGRDVSVRLRSRDGRTRIVVEERLARQATGLFVGLGVGGGVGPMGAYIAAIVKLGVVGLLFPLLWIPVMLLLARTIFVALSRRRERALAEVMRRIEHRAARWSSRSPAARMRVRAAEGDLEADAEADAEAADAADQRARS